MRFFPVIQFIPVYSAKRPPRRDDSYCVVWVFSQLIKQTVPRYGAIVAFLFGVWRLYVVRTFRRSIPAIHGSAAASQLWLQGQYFSKGSPHTYVIVTVNIVGAAFLTLLIESFLSLCSFRPCFDYSSKAGGAFMTMLIDKCVFFWMRCNNQRSYYDHTLVMIVPVNISSTSPDIADWELPFSMFVKSVRPRYWVLPMSTRDFSTRYRHLPTQEMCNETPKGR